MPCNFCYLWSIIQLVMTGNDSVHNPVQKRKKTLLEYAWRSMCIFIQGNKEVCMHYKRQYSCVPEIFYQHFAWQTNFIKPLNNILGETCRRTDMTSLLCPDSIYFEQRMQKRKVGWKVIFSSRLGKLSPIRLPPWENPGMHTHTHT
jgi:hypothetical protein